MGHVASSGHFDELSHKDMEQAPQWHSIYHAKMALQKNVDLIFCIAYHAV